MGVNTRYSFDGNGNLLIWGTINGRTGWIQISTGAPLYAVAQSPSNAGWFNYQSLQNGSWYNNFVVMYGTPSVTFLSADPNLVAPQYQYLVPGAPNTGISAAPSQAIAPTASYAPAPAASTGYIAPQPAGPASSDLLAMILVGQQQTNAVNQMLSSSTNLAKNATTLTQAAQATVAVGQAVAAMIAGPAAPNSPGSGQTAILLSVLGSSGLGQLEQINSTLNSDVQSAADQTAINAAFDSYLTSMRSLIATTSNNALVAAVAGGASGTNALLGVLFAQNAVSAFNAQCPSETGGATLALLQAAIADFNGALSTYLSALFTANLLPAIAG